MTNVLTKRLRAVLVGGTIVLVLGASCGDDAPAPGPGPGPAPAPRPAASPSAQATADAGTESFDSAFLYSYSPIGKRDPFRSPVGRKGPASMEPGDSSPCSDPLCQVDIDELSLVAVVSGDANPMAMLQDRNGIGHIVRRNSKMGRQGGKVTAILRDCIVITSFVQTADGKAQPVRTDLCVAKDQRAAPVLDLLEGRFRE